MFKKEYGFLYRCIKRTYRYIPTESKFEFPQNGKKNFQILKIPFYTCVCVTQASSNFSAKPAYSSVGSAEHPFLAWSWSAGHTTCLRKVMPSPTLAVSTLKTFAYPHTTACIPNNKENFQVYILYIRASSVYITLYMCTWTNESTRAYSWILTMHDSLPSCILYIPYNIYHCSVTASTQCAYTHVSYVFYFIILSVHEGGNLIFAVRHRRVEAT